MSDVDRMVRMRARRKEGDVRELHFWVRNEDADKAKKITEVFQKLAWYAENSDKVQKLEDELEFKLKMFQSWESYLRKKSLL